MSDEQTGAPPAAPTGESAPQSGAARQGLTGDSFRSFIFVRELAEVHLLLDNVATSAGKKLPPPPADASKGPDLIEQICEISWPASGSVVDQAQQAATLIRARDQLNNLAAPATGMTIAFTLLVAGELKDDDERPLERGGAGWGGGSVPSRFMLATLAFPNLLGRAKTFRRFVWWLIAALALLLLATSALSWNIAAGNGILGQWTQLTQSQVNLAKQIADAQPTEGSGAGPTNALAGQTPDTADASTPTNGMTAASGPASSVRCQLCDQRLENQTELAVANANLDRWITGGWGWLGYPDRLCQPLACRDSTDGMVNEQWASTLLNVLGGTVLPILYGLLGAGAAVMRTIWARIKAGTLAPRHFMRAWIQLVLGAVIGGCIGLFVTPASASAAASVSATPGLLGQVPLSASALCFIAGFGVEGAFRALESLISRVFNTDDPGANRASP